MARPRLEFSTTPWFRSHRGWALGVSVAMFVGIFVGRYVDHGTNDAVSLFYVLPVALLAIAFGVRAGLLGGVTSAVLLGTWAVLADVHLTPLGWTARVTPMLLLGILLGSAADRLEAAAVAERQLLAAELREREAAEINDSIVQGLAVAKWLLETGEYDRSLALITETMSTAQQLVTDLLKGRPITPGMFRRGNGAMERQVLRAGRHH